jgi:opacity protein-like surface antigen
MQKTSNLILFIILLISANTALATQVVGTYGGFHIGSAKTDYSVSEAGYAGASKSNNNNNIGWDIFTGYQLNANLALEIAYMEFQKVKFTNIAGISSTKASVETKAADLVGKFIFPFSAMATLYAKGGLAYVQVESAENSVAIKNGFHNSNSHGIRPVFGVGGTYEFYPNLSADLYFAKIYGSGNIQDATFVGIGLLYAFG